MLKYSGYNSYLLKFIFLYLFVSIRAGYSQKLPPVHNFSIKDYKAGNQNWGITESDGYLYVANNEGLLEFDGLAWRLYTLPNKTIIRSVVVHDSKIYTGSYEEFGYWEKSDTGELVYTSLVPTLEDNEIETEAIWGIFPLEDRVIFKSFAKIYIYKNNKTITLNPKATLNVGVLMNNTFYVSMSGKGIFTLKGESFELVKGTDKFKNYKIRAILPYGEDELMIGTSLNGCFVFKEGEFKKWEHPVNEILKEHQLNTISYNKGSKLFFGTIKNGLYVVDEEDGSYYNLNIDNGLQNNTILASTISKDNLLWLALDNGVSATPINYPAYYLNPSKQNIGAVYDVVSLNNKTYLATNTGIYKIDERGINFIKGSQGHTWDLFVCDDEVICGHNLATYSIQNDRLTTISHRNGGYTFIPVPTVANTFIQGNYGGISIFTKKGRIWTSLRIRDINFPVKQIVFEQPHIIWLAHAYKGVYRVQLSADYLTVKSIEAYHNNTLLNPYDIRLYKIENDIAFFSKGQWFVFNSIEKKIEPFVSLNNILGPYNSAFPISDTNKSPYVFKDKDDNIFLRNKLQDSTSQVFIPNRYYNNLLVNKYEKAIVINDSLTYILLYNNVLAINQKKINKQLNVHPPRIERVFVNKTPQSIKGDFSLKSKDTLSVEVSIPFLSNNSIVYKLSQDASKTWKPSNGKMEFYNLPYRNIEMQLKTLTASSNSSNNDTKLSFYVKPPWYMGFYGVLAFICVLLITLYIISTINNYVLIKHKKYLDDQFLHEQELLRKEEALNHEKKLNEFQKKQHVRELNAKTKELANTAMAMTKKNELLLSLKNDLLFFKNEVISKHEFNKLIKTLDKNIDNVKDWEVFESNFNQIHESFFKTLLEKHPDVLTPKDLRLCAYLKLNLSTKEISPLMSISPRGVEIHRYRLRKKLNLSTNQNLNEYLMNIS
ncbi:helix-turn-helix and ligand-binding sensor domain-containing protein [Abyssalbus ytuae]|uniref:LuxR C-terminal-related transcriptional regulator n=1 Tax=Abyssalbus ytuae TaxID=2926907 RepID=A0A9E7D1I6_9FLAO|nr:LuxR C-terminal-related transcriptional regulator [Abyssalbus ytuae]UOB17138.1 LuxR C-terminal-related transcriptional regulator [Abyssalbus ytuae]